MLLLQHEWQCESRDVERQILYIEHPQHIDTLDNLLNTTLQLAHPRLLRSVVVKDVLKHLTAHSHLLRQVHLLESRRQQILLRNLHLVLRLVATQRHDNHAVKEDTIHTSQVIATEHKHGTAHIQRDARQILILEQHVLNRIREMNKEILDLLTLLRCADLVQLIKHQDHRHGLRLCDTVGNLATVAALIDKLVTCVGRGIGVATQTHKLERPLERLGDTVLDETRLTNTGRTHEHQGQPRSRRIGNLAGDELHDLELGVLLAVDRLLQAPASLLHERCCQLLTIINLHRHLLVYTKRDANKLLHPGSELVILAGARIHHIESVVAIHHKSHCVWDEIHLEKLEHERLFLLNGVRPGFKGCKKCLLLDGLKALELVDLIINGVRLSRIGDELHELANIGALLLHVVALGHHPLSIIEAATKREGETLKTSVLLIFLLLGLILFLILLVLILFLILLLRLFLLGLFRLGLNLLLLALGLPSLPGLLPAAVRRSRRRRGIPLTLLADRITRLYGCSTTRLADLILQAGWELSSPLEATKLRRSVTQLRLCLRLLL